MKIDYPAALPISAHTGEIAALLRAHQVVIVAGATGSGKTTQLPKICLDAGFGARGMIGHTQPRRLAARTVAARIAEELEVELGAEVGYAVRFGDRTGPATRVRVMTDGILLTEIRRDRALTRYDALIIDEAHERSLNIDFLLGYLKRLLPRRPELRLVITSATIDVESFAAHFDAPIVQVGGRGYPVEIRYRPLDRAPASDEDDGVVAALREIAAERPGPARDVLVFQTGEREIFETARLLRREFAEAFEVLPLYARLSVADQHRVFERSQRRRVVLATNVAETSITVPNIGYVVDPGFARINRYSFRSRLERLPIEAVSKAAADQRAGRCGRVAPGVCYRLYAETDYAGRPDFTDPEIRRVNLASVVLQMRVWRLGRIESFPFLDPPDPRAVRAAVRLLEELGAITDDKVTDIGQAMARLPVDPRLARMLVAASRLGSLAETAIVVAALAVQDPRERPLAHQAKADAAHAEFADDTSDFLAFLKLWEWLENLREQATGSGFRKALARRYLSYARVREWRDVHRQVLIACQALGWRLNPQPAKAEALHRALIPGCLSLVGMHDERGRYVGARDLNFRIFPGSALAARHPRWLIAAEIAETSRVYARTVAGVEAKWIEEAAAHLVKRSHSEPHWSAARGEVMAYETVSLYGLVLAERRLVRFAPIDAAHARTLFIREGLLPGAFKRLLPFLAHNLALVREIRELEARGRRRDLLVHDDVLFDFYAARLPDDVAGVAELERWLAGRMPDALHMDRALLLARDAAATTETEFPSVLERSGTELRVRYRFAPGTTDDGVTIEVPLGLLDSIAPEDVEWMVPGMLEAQVEAWLRTLPKHLRKQLAPLGESAAGIARVLVGASVYRRGSFLNALSDCVATLFRVRLGRDDWDRGRVPEHLQVNVQVLDDHGKLLGQGRDLEAVRQQFESRLKQRVASGASVDESGLTAFPVQGVADERVVEDSGGRLLVYPALVDEGETVALKAFATRPEQARANRAGYPRLAWLTLGAAAGYFRRELDKRRDLQLRFATLADAATLRDDVLLGVAWYAFFEDGPLPDTAQQFAQRIAERRPGLADVFNRTVEALEAILAARAELAGLARELGSPAFAAARTDVDAWLARLIPPDLLRATPSARLASIPGYVEAARYRLRHLQGRVERDAELAGRLEALRARVEAVRATGRLAGETTDVLRFRLEDLRVALFAQPLAVRLKSGADKVSEKRFDAELLVAERAAGLR